MTIGTGSPMGEGKDLKYAVNGQAWRVRVAKLAEIATVAPARSAAPIAPSGAGLSVSVAALDADDAVMVDARGRLMIFSAEVLTIDAAAMAAPGFDPEAALLALTEKQIATAAEQLQARLLLALVETAYVEVDNTIGDAAGIGAVTNVEAVVDPAGEQLHAERQARAPADAEAGDADG